MSQHTQPSYEFGDLPLDPVDPGTTLLVTGPGRAPSRLAEDIVLAGNDDEEGMVFVSTNTSARSRIAQCRGSVPDLRLSHLGVVDATGSRSTDTDTDALVGTVSTTGDLTGISIRFSQLYAQLANRGVRRVRACFDSISILLLYTDLRTMTRFVHTMVGRVRSTDGLGVFVVDPSMHDSQTVHTLSRLCDGQLDVRATETGHELRAEGLSDQPREWQPVTL